MKIQNKKFAISLISVLILLFSVSTIYASCSSVLDSGYLTGFDGYIVGSTQYGTSTSDDNIYWVWVGSGDGWNNRYEFRITNRNVSKWDMLCFDWTYDGKNDECYVKTGKDCSQAISQCLVKGTFGSYTSYYTVASLPSDYIKACWDGDRAWCDESETVRMNGAFYDCDGGTSPQIGYLTTKGTSLPVRITRAEDRQFHCADDTRYYDQYYTSTNGWGSAGIIYAGYCTGLSICDENADDISFGINGAIIPDDPCRSIVGGTCSGSADCFGDLVCNMTSNVCYEFYAHTLPSIDSVTTDSSLIPNGLIVWDITITSAESMNYNYVAVDCNNDGDIGVDIYDGMDWTNAYWEDLGGGQFRKELWCKYDSIGSKNSKFFVSTDYLRPENTSYTKSFSIGAVNDSCAGIYPTVSSCVAGVSSIGLYTPVSVTTSATGVESILYGIGCNDESPTYWQSSGNFVDYCSYTSAGTKTIGCYARYDCNSVDTSHLTTSILVQNTSGYSECYCSSCIWTDCFDYTNSVVNHGWTGVGYTYLAPSSGQLYLSTLNENSIRHTWNYLVSGNISFKVQPNTDTSNVIRLYGQDDLGFGAEFYNVVLGFDNGEFWYGSGTVIGSYTNGEIYIVTISFNADTDKFSVVVNKASDLSEVLSENDISISETVKNFYAVSILTTGDYCTVNSDCANSVCNSTMHSCIASSVYDRFLVSGVLSAEGGGGTGGLEENFSIVNCSTNKYYDWCMEDVDCTQNSDCSTGYCMLELNEPKCSIFNYTQCDIQRRPRDWMCIASSTGNYKMEQLIAWALSKMLWVLVILALIMLIVIIFKSRRR